MLTMLDPDRMPLVVFLTAYSEYALKAFEENATDYLLKPVDPERLKKTLQRLRDSGASNPALFEPETPLAQIPCIGLNRIFLVKVSVVEYAISRAGGVYIIDLEGRERFTELTLKTLEERTPLIRCHRQVLVNPETINEIVFHESGLAEIITTGDRTVPVSRRFLKSLKERLAIG
jgi:two-component system LytT family response regulator